MTDQQSTAIRAVLAAAPDAALRRVVRQPLRLWKAGGMTSNSDARCLDYTLRDSYVTAAVAILFWQATPRYIDTLPSQRAFDAACAADGLRETVGTCKTFAREELKRRGS